MSNILGSRRGRQDRRSQRQEQQQQPMSYQNSTPVQQQRQQFPPGGKPGQTAYQNSTSTQSLGGGGGGGGGGGSASSASYLHENMQLAEAEPVVPDWRASDHTGRSVYQEFACNYLLKPVQTGQAKELLSSSDKNHFLDDFWKLQEGIHDGLTEHMIPEIFNVVNPWLEVVPIYSTTTHALVDFPGFLDKEGKIVMRSTEHVPQVMSRTGHYNPGGMLKERPRERERGWETYRDNFSMDMNFFETLKGRHNFDGNTQALYYGANLTLARITSDSVMEAGRDEYNRRMEDEFPKDRLSFQSFLAKMKARTFGTQKTGSGWRGIQHQQQKAMADRQVYPDMVMVTNGTGHFVGNVREEGREYWKGGLATYQPQTPLMMTKGMNPIQVLESYAFRMNGADDGDLVDTTVNSLYVSQLFPLLPDTTTRFTDDDYCTAHRSILVPDGVTRDYAWIGVDEMIEYGLVSANLDDPEGEELSPECLRVLYPGLAGDEASMGENGLTIRDVYEHLNIVQSRRVQCTKRKNRGGSYDEEGGASRKKRKIDGKDLNRLESYLQDVPGSLRVVFGSSSPENAYFINIAGDDFDALQALGASDASAYGDDNTPVYPFSAEAKKTDVQKWFTTFSEEGGDSTFMDKVVDLAGTVNFGDVASGSLWKRISGAENGAEMFADVVTRMARNPTTKLPANSNYAQIIAALNTPQTESTGFSFGGSDSSTARQEAAPQERIWYGGEDGYSGGSSHRRRPEPDSTRRDRFEEGPPPNREHDAYAKCDETWPDHVLGMPYNMRASYRAMARNDMPMPFVGKAWRRAIHMFTGSATFMVKGKRTGLTVARHSNLIVGRDTNAFKANFSARLECGSFIARPANIGHVPHISALGCYSGIGTRFRYPGQLDGDFDMEMTLAPYDTKLKGVFHDASGAISPSLMESSEPATPSDLYYAQLNKLEQADKDLFVLRDPEASKPIAEPTLCAISSHLKYNRHTKAHDKQVDGHCEFGIHATPTDYGMMQDGGGDSNIAYRHHV